MPKCKINGHEVEVHEGATIIEAFKKLEQEIAHYCWHPGLSVAGVCRLCMVEIEGVPKLQIACNTVVKDGMVITNQSENVKDTVKWGLDFHLINHPLDCPICDQAGECGLQDQYMQFGKYDPEMSESKVKKHKVIDLGPTVVLDSERCILCSRCVRFTDEVSKTHELGIFNRGDRSEIGTFDGRPLDNGYSLNTVDICPVGALTSKDFRFRQRVWYLKEAESICPGCSTGCNVKVYYNEEGLWRTKPRYNEQVNGYWMCDEGRNTYKFVNETQRLKQVRRRDSGVWLEEEVFAAVTHVRERMESLLQNEQSGEMGLILTGQYTNEEYASLLGYWKSHIQSPHVFHWKNNEKTFDDFDGLLIRGDKNPNTKGLEAALKSHGLKALSGDLKDFLVRSKVKWVLVLGPENHGVYPELQDYVKILNEVPEVIWLTACAHKDLDQMSTSVTLIPAKTYIEKSGTFTNANGLDQTFKLGVTVVAQALTVQELVRILEGQMLDKESRPRPVRYLKTNFFTSVRGGL